MTQGSAPRLTMGLVNVRPPMRSAAGVIAETRNITAPKRNIEAKPKTFVRIFFHLISKFKMAVLELKGRPGKDAHEWLIGQTKLWCLQDEELSRICRANRNGI